MRGGLLTIGSLLWDDDRARVAWRAERLAREGRRPVRVPIRYGRRSQSRGNTFTMSFDASGPLGSAVAVPFAYAASRPEDLLEEGIALWSAEQREASSEALGCDWGCVGLLAGPRLPDSWKRHWSQAFRERAPYPVPPVDEGGMLRIGWPAAAQGAELDFDFLLAAVTRPEATPPTLEAIADAWVDQQEGHERYFFENVRSGIRTSEDLDIWRRMLERGAPWLTRLDYASAVAILNKGERRDV